MMKRKITKQKERKGNDMNKRTIEKIKKIAEKVNGIIRYKDEDVLFDLMWGMDSLYGFRKMGAEVDVVFKDDNTFTIFITAKPGKHLWTSAITIEPLMLGDTLIGKVKWYDLNICCEKIKCYIDLLDPTDETWEDWKEQMLEAETYRENERKAKKVKK